MSGFSAGKADKLRLHDLRKGFELRGFYLDNQSLQQLVSFYERMGGKVIGQDLANEERWQNSVTYQFTLTQ